MTERELEKKTMGVLEATLAPPVGLWKIHDNVTGGQPDLEVCWNEYTSKIEFKKLKGDETVHDKWEDERQLITLVRYEETTRRGWVVCFAQRDRQHRETLIYRPTRLLRGNLPTDGILFDYTQLALALWEKGVIRCEGFRQDVVARLIWQTHQ